MSKPNKEALELAEYLSERFDGTTNHAERMVEVIQEAFDRTARRVFFETLRAMAKNTCQGCYEGETLSEHDFEEPDNGYSEIHWTHANEVCGTYICGFDEAWEFWHQVKIAAEQP